MPHPFAIFSSSPYIQSIWRPLSYWKRINFQKVRLHVHIYIKHVTGFWVSNSLIYGMFASYINAFFIFKLWDKSFCVYTPPVNEVSTCALIYIFGLLVNNRITDFYMSLLVGFSAYICTFFDTLGFAMMHIACGFLQQIFLSHLKNGN